MQLFLPSANMETKKEKINAAAGKVATAAAEKAKTATGWTRWLWFGVAAAAAIVALFTATGCVAGFKQTAGETAGLIVILPNSQK